MYERELTTELMRQLFCLKHSLRMNAGGLGQACIQPQRGSTNSLARLIGELQQILFNMELILHVGNVGSGGSRFQCGAMGGLPGAIGRGQVDPRLQSYQPRAEHDYQQSGGPKHPVRAYRILGGIVPSSPFRLRFVQAQTLLLVLG
jgi:hypothetical protein